MATMKETLRRTRWIWAVVYAFLTGMMSVGRHNATGVMLFAVGGTALFFLTTRWMDRMCQEAAEVGSHSAGTVTVKFEADTAQATAAIEALRAIERHGGAEILDRAFTGFLALPEKASEPWRDVLGISGSIQVSTEVIEKAFREKVSKCHPDHGGNVEQFHRILQAREAAKAEVVR
jgi:hypothetical protein